MATIEISKRELAAILDVLGASIESSCGCNEVIPGDGPGYLGHQKDCWVHMNRKRLEIVSKFVNRARQAKSQHPSARIVRGLQSIYSFVSAGIEAGNASELIQHTSRSEQNEVAEANGWLGGVISRHGTRPA